MDDNYDGEGGFYGSDEDYQNDYIKAVVDQTQGLDNETAELLFAEMQEKHDFKRTGNPRADAEINVNRARRSLDGSFDASTRDLLDHIAKETGKSRGHVRAWAKKALAKPTPSYLSNLDE